MIELIDGLPDGVVGIEAVGEVTADDYETIAIPALERALATHDKIRLIHVLGDRLTTHTAGALWDDTRIGLAHARRFERIAVVTEALPGTSQGGSAGDARWNPTLLERRTRRR